MTKLIVKRFIALGGFGVRGDSPIVMREAEVDEFVDTWTSSKHPGTKDSYRIDGKYFGEVEDVNYVPEHDEIHFWLNDDTSLHGDLYLKVESDEVQRKLREYQQFGWIVQQWADSEENNDS